SVSSIQMDPNAAVRLAVGIAPHLGDRAGHVRRTAEATDPFLALPRPAELGGHSVQSPERVGVEEGLAVQANPREESVVENKLDHVSVSGIAGDLQHPPVPQQVADRGTSLVVGRAVRKLVVAAVGLMCAANLLLLAGTVRRCAVVECPACSRDG